MFYEGTDNRYLQRLEYHGSEPWLPAMNYGY
jgi:hypothetical protein